MGRGGNPPLLATGRGRGAPGVIGRGRGRSDAGALGAVARARASAIARHRPGDLGLALFALLDLGSGGFLAHATVFFGTHQLGAFRLEARRFGGGLFASVGGCLRGGRGGRLLFGCSLNVGGLSATSDRFGGGGRRRGSGFWRSGGRAAAARRRGRCGLLFGAHSLLALPSSPDACNLIVREHAHVAAKWNVHLTK